MDRRDRRKPNLIFGCGLQPAQRSLHVGRRWGLPVPARGVSMHARGLRLRGVQRMLAITCPPVLPSTLMNGVGTPFAIISQLNTLPALPPVNASMAALRLATHDSGPGWLATPFLYDSFIHNSTPVLSRRTHHPARDCFRPAHSLRPIGKLRGKFRRFFFPAPSTALVYLHGVDIFCEINNNTNILREFSLVFCDKTN